MSVEHAEAYTALREQITALVREQGAECGRTPCPATPEWNVHDVLAHVVGVTDDVVAGRLDGIASNAWTAKQVETRRDASIGALLDEWSTTGPAFESFMGAVPPEVSGQALLDTVTHEYDLRHTLAAPGPRAGVTFEIAWAWMAGSRAGAPTPALRMVTEVDTVVVGTGEPVAAVEASRFELLRAQTGRRTADEIAAYTWDGEPQPQLVLASEVFSMRTTPLNE